MIKITIGRKKKKGELKKKKNILHAGFLNKILWFGYAKATLSNIFVRLQCNLHKRAQQKPQKIAEEMK